MTDLVEFLRARLKEDLDWATMAKNQSGSGDWEPEVGENAPTLARVRIGHDRFFESIGEEGFAVEHIARHDPARVLREVEAKRRIVDDFTHWQPHDPGFDALEPVVRLLALPYADHEDFREEWKP